MSKAQISEPKLDVWQVKNGVPIRVYEGACIHNGDIGSRCEFLNHTGSNPELVIGTDGFETDLHFLTFENGEFGENRSLKYEFDGSDYVWSINGETVDEVEGMELMNESRNNINKFTGIVDENLGQTEKSIRDDLNAVYKAL